MAIIFTPRALLICDENSPFYSGFQGFSRPRIAWKRDLIDYWVSEFGNSCVGKTPVRTSHERVSALLQASRPDDMGLHVVVLDDWIVLRLSSVLECPKSGHCLVDFVGPRTFDGSRRSPPGTPRT